MKKIVAFMAVLVALNLSLGLGFSSYSMAVDKVYGVTATVGGLVQKVFTELTFGEDPSTNTFSLKDGEEVELSIVEYFEALHSSGKKIILGVIPVFEGDSVCAVVYSDFVDIPSGIIAEHRSLLWIEWFEVKKALGATSDLSIGENEGYTITRKMGNVLNLYPQ